MTGGTKASYRVVTPRRTPLPPPVPRRHGSGPGLPRTSPSRRGARSRRAFTPGPPRSARPRAPGPVPGTSRLGMPLSASVPPHEGPAPRYDAPTARPVVAQRRGGPREGSGSRTGALSDLTAHTPAVHAPARGRGQRRIGRRRKRAQPARPVSPLAVGRRRGAPAPWPRRPVRFPRAPYGSGSVPGPFRRAAPGPVRDGIRHPRRGGRRSGEWACSGRGSRNAATSLPAGMYPTCRTRRGVAQLGSASALGAEGRGFKSRHPDHLRDHLARPYTVIAFGACRRCRYYASCTPVCLILWISTGSPPGGESAGAALAPAETKKSAPKETEP